MPDTKTSALTELTAFDGDEEFPVVDDDDGTPVTKRVTIETLTAEVTDGIATAISDGDASTLTSAQSYADGKVSNTAYGSGWDTDTTHAPSKNATYDEIELRAPKASPTFTGTPAAPTAAQGTNTTQLATTAYVQTEAGLLVPKSVLTTDGDLLTRSGGAVARITRASLAADTAFSGTYAPLAGFTYSSYTPTLSQNGTRTTSAMTAHYIQIGKHVHAWGSCTVSNAGTAGNGIGLTLPVAPHASLSGFPLGFGLVVDASVDNYTALCVYDGPGLVFFDTNRTGSQQRIGISPSFALASGDSMSWNITYEAA